MFINLPCEHCAGKRCDACNHTGLLTIKTCPRSLPTSEQWDLCDLSDLAENGSWPILGGVLDQSDSFLNAHSFIQNITHRLLNPKRSNG